MKNLKLLFVLLITTIAISCVENPRKVIKEKLGKSSLTKDNNKKSGITIEYERFAMTKFNPNDFSWKFLEEYEESGDIKLIAESKSLILNNPKKGKELFKIIKIQKSENGFIATTDKDNIIIIAIDYNRIAIGRVGSDIFGMFIFKDSYKEILNTELQKML